MAHITLYRPGVFRSVVQIPRSRSGPIPSGPQIEEGKAAWRALKTGFIQGVRALRGAAEGTTGGIGGTGGMGGREAEDPPSPPAATGSPPPGIPPSGAPLSRERERERPALLGKLPSWPRSTSASSKAALR